MPSTSNDVINIRCHTGFRWATKFGYICRNNALPEPMKSLDQYDMVLHHYQGCGKQWFWAQHSIILWPTPSVQRGPPSTVLPTIIGHIKHCKTIHTNRVKPRLHGTSHNWSDYGHKNQEHSPIENPIIWGCQIWPTPGPRQVAHQGPSSAKVSPSHGGTQRNGYHWFLKGEDWSKWILVASLLFHLDPHHYLF